MAKKQETKKRRVAIEQQRQRQEAAVAKAQRRKQLITGGVVAFLALALIAPLTAGLIGSSGSSSNTVVTDSTLPTTTLPTTTVPVSIPWATEAVAGASIEGSTPCPATDGTAERTTQFAEAPPICIAPDTAYELNFSTAIGDFTLPIDPTLDEDAANLATVFGWYRTYEQTPVAAIAGGLLWVGSTGDTGFTIPITPQDTTNEDLYPVGSVLALPAAEGGLTGALLVVTEESGQALLQAEARYVQVGMIDDLTEITAILNAPEAAEFLQVDTVEVTEVS